MSDDAIPEQPITLGPPPQPLGLCQACEYLDPIDSTIGYCRVGRPVFAGPQITPGRTGVAPLGRTGVWPTCRHVDWCGEFLKK